MCHYRLDRADSGNFFKRKRGVMVSQQCAKLSNFGCVGSNPAVSATESREAASHLAWDQVIVGSSPTSLTE